MLSRPRSKTWAASHGFRGGRETLREEPPLLRRTGGRLNEMGVMMQRPPTSLALSTFLFRGKEPRGVYEGYFSLGSLHFLHARGDAGME